MKGISQVVEKPNTSQFDNSDSDECSEARNHLRRLRATWVPGAPPEIKQKLTQLKETLEVVERCIRDHDICVKRGFLLELNKQVGWAIIKGLLNEHLEILDYLANLKQTMKATTSIVTDREKLLAYEGHIRDSIRALLQLMEQHADRVEAIVSLVQEARDTQTEHEPKLSGVGIKLRHKMLVCLDGSKLSEQILPYATDEARCPGGQLVLLQVFSLDDAYLGGIIQTIYLEEEKEAKVYLERVTRPLLKKGINVEYAVVHAITNTTTEIGQGIINYAKNHDIDFIALTTHGRSGVKRLVFGSVADYVLRHSGLPVLMIKPREQET